MRFAFPSLLIYTTVLLACSQASGERLTDALQDGGAGTGQPSSDDSGLNYMPSPAAGCDKMDILFVIDNSGSMGEEQENLAANFPRFIEVLDGFQGGGLQYRLGVTTTALGDIEFLDSFVSTAEEGTLLQTPSMEQPWLDRGSPNLTATFSELATVGLGGSFTEQPLKAAQVALDPDLQGGPASAGGPNAGFRRQDALLALVFLTDEDDGSKESSEDGGGFFDIFLPGGGSQAPVSQFVDAYDRIAMGRERWAAAVIAGDEDPECVSDFGEADYAERLLEFVDLAGSQATFGSICSGDLSVELDAALNTFSAACETFVPLI